MAIDQLAKVVVEFKGDTSDLKAKLKDLQGEEKKLADQALARQEATNKGIESMVAGLGTVTAAIGVAKLAWDGFQKSLEFTRLQTAASGANIEQLKRASHGLKSEMELLSDAARLQHGQFKLNQAQIAGVEQAMLALNRRGFESQKVHEAVLQAVTALKTDGLDDLGIHIDNTGLSMDNATDRAELFEKTLKALAKVSSEVADGQDSAAERTQASAVSFQDAMDKMQRSLGELVIAMQPMIESLATVVGQVGDLAQAASKWNAPHLSAGASFGLVPFAISHLNGGGPDALDVTMGGDSYSQTPDQATAPDTVMSPYEKAQWLAYRKAQEELAKRLAEAAKARAEAYREMVRQLANKGAKEAGESVIADLESQLNTPQSVGLGIQSPGYGDLQGTLNRIDFDQRRAGLAQQHTSRLEGIFGPLDEFDAYKSAWQGLSSTVTTAYSAMVDGSMSFGKAVKLGAAQAIKGEGAHMQILALKELGLAAASLALGPIGGVSAAGHLKAAAVLEAGALAAGFVAHELGGSGGGSRATGARPGGGVPTGAGGSAGGGDGRDVIIAYADPFAEDSPRQRQLKARNIVGRVLGSSGVKYQ